MAAGYWLVTANKEQLNFNLWWRQTSYRLCCRLLASCCWLTWTVSARWPHRPLTSHMYYWWSMISRPRRWSPHHLLSSWNTHSNSRIKVTKIEYLECGYFLSASQYAWQTWLATESVVASEKLDNDIDCPYTRMGLWSLNSLISQISQIMRQSVRHDQNIASADLTTAQHLMCSLQVAWIRFSGGELHAADGVQRRWPRPRVVLLGLTFGSSTIRSHVQNVFPFPYRGRRPHDEPVRFPVTAGNQWNEGVSLVNTRNSELTNDRRVYSREQLLENSDGDRESGI